MPNIKSAKKRVKVIEKKTLRNQMVKSALKTAIKRFDAAVEAKDGAVAKDNFRFAVKKIEERKEADILWFTQKANKAPARDLLCSRRPQVPSRITEGAPP